jgi:hypothetical protein
MNNENNEIPQTDDATPAPVAKPKKERKPRKAKAAPAASAPVPKAAKAPKKKGVGLYPFRSKASILAEIMVSDDFAKASLLVIHARQTSYEQEAKTTKDRNARGFMSSHAVRGTELAIKILDCEELTSEEMEKVRGLASRYGRQLAQHDRAVQIERDPALGAVAEVFSAN